MKEIVQVNISDMSDIPVKHGKNTRDTNTSGATWWAGSRRNGAPRPLYELPPHTNSR